MDKKDIYEAKEELALVHGKSIILEDIKDIKKINYLIEYINKLDTDLRKDMVAAGKKVTNALLAAAEAYMKEEEKPTVTYHGSREAEVLFNFNLCKIPIKKVMEVEKLLNEMGISFDTGGDSTSRNWEWDWSLNGPVNVFFKKFVEDNPNNRYMSKSMKKRIKIQKGEGATNDAESSN
jgi:hypothetical protein